MSISEKEAAALGLVGGKRRKSKPRPTEPISGMCLAGHGSMVIQVINWHPAKVNEWAGYHWKKKHRLSRADRDVIASIVPLRARVYGGRRRVSLDIVLSLRQRRSPDADAYWKLLLDNLVSLGFLRDDSPQWLDIGPVTFQRGSRKETRIILEDL